MRRFRAIGTVVIIATAAATLLAACSSSTNNANKPASTKGITVPTGGTKMAGGTATWAELPNATPNFIFPFDPPGLLQRAQHQPVPVPHVPAAVLVRAGQQRPNLNLSLSVGKNPVYTNDDKTVTIDLNNYKWSNGESMSAQDVVFWMNMMHAEKDNFGAYVPGINAIPDDVTNVVATSPTEVTFTLTGAVNTNWYTYNNLSQVTPLPKAWDITAKGAAAGLGWLLQRRLRHQVHRHAPAPRCSTFLATQAGYNPANPKATNNSFSTYATNPIWQVVDGPWHLTAFDAIGNVTMVPNPNYTGPVKAELAKFVEVPLHRRAHRVQRPARRQARRRLPPAGQRAQGDDQPATWWPAQDPRLSDFYLNEYYGWEFGYFPINFNSSGDNGAAGKIISQLYFRQAMQTLVDQPDIISKVFKGYGVPQYGPVPPTPPTYFFRGEPRPTPTPTTRPRPSSC